MHPTSSGFPGRSRGARPAALAGTILLGLAGLAGPACEEREIMANSVPAVSGFASAYDAALARKLEEVAPQDYPDLHNLFRLSDDILSGSEPEGRSGLERLARMGVKTILSVDGKAPDAETAAELGMRYVHVPIRYSGIGPEEMLRIAKTFREMGGPFYVHCFHGKHRGPAAAAIGRVVLDDAPREEAMAEMRQWCGTSGKYEGLYRSVAWDPIPSARATARYEWDFPAARRFRGLRRSMIEIARVYDRVRYLSSRNWEAGAEHPDLDSANEAEKLAGLLLAAGDLDEVRSRPRDFRGWIEAAAREAEGLRESLAGRPGQDVAAARQEAARSLDALAGLCARCHASYRNE